MGKAGSNKNQCSLMRLLYFFIVLISLSFYIPNKSGKQNGHTKQYHFSEGDIWETTLVNKKRMKVKVLNYGATVSQIFVPDRAGNFCDVVLGFDSIKSYFDRNPYFGCLVGRYANRIAKAQFVMNNDTFKLFPNTNGNSIHGGAKGFNKKIWDIISFTDSSLVLSYLSKDGEEGFPGNLKVQVTYIVSSANELIINYSATTDKPTPVNLTNHSYFNLSAGADPTILNHELYINADRFTEVSETLIPTGLMSEVKKGPMDFTISKRVGQDLEQIPGGYDHNYVLNKSVGNLSLAAVLYDPLSGRGIEVRTTQPGIQFYSGNFLSTSIVGKNGTNYQKYSGLCLETQHFPDSPNHPEFPSTILSPGEKFKETTIYKFFVKY
jgi:aldose 1-epimerase